MARSTASVSARAEILDHHASDFSEEELDDFEPSDEEDDPFEDDSPLESPPAAAPPADRVDRVAVPGVPQLASRPRMVR